MHPNWPYKAILSSWHGRSSLLAQLPNSFAAKYVQFLKVFENELDLILLLSVSLEYPLFSNHQCSC